MAKTTYHELSMKMSIDGKDFLKGTKLTKKELSNVRKEIRMLDPAQLKMEKRLHKLGELSKKDARFTALHTKALDAQEKQMRKASKTLDRQNELLKENGKLAKGLKAIGFGATAALAAGAVAGRQFVRGFAEEVRRVDEVGKKAAAIGVSTDFLSGLGFVANKTSGLGADRIRVALTKMTLRVSQAAQGLGEAQKVLDELNLSAKELSAIGPEKAFFKIARAMDEVTNEHDRLRMATKLFDDEQASIHTTMALTNDEYKLQIELAKQLGVVIKQANADKMAVANDAIDEFQNEWNRGTRNLYADSAPVMTGLLRAGSAGLQSSGKLFSGEGGNKKGDLLFGNMNLSRFGNLFTDALKAGHKRRNDEKTAAVQAMIGKHPLAVKMNQEQAAWGGIGPMLSQASGAFASGSNSLVRGLGGFLANTPMAPSGPGFQRNRTTTSIQRSSSGPMASVAAGSSEAFKRRYTQSSSKSVEVKLAVERTKAAKDSAGYLERIQMLLAKQALPTFANLER